MEINQDCVIQEASKTISDYIFEAKKKALQDGIMANTVVLSKHIAKVNAFDFCYGDMVLHLPPMICGLEVILSDELPEKYDFAVVEAPETVRDRIVRQAKAEAVTDVLEKISQEIEQALESNYKVIAVLKQMDELGYRVQGKIDALRGLEGFIAELKEKFEGVRPNVDYDC